MKRLLTFGILGLLLLYSFKTTTAQDSIRFDTIPLIKNEAQFFGNFNSCTPKGKCLNFDLATSDSTLPMLELKGRLNKVIRRESLAEGYENLFQAQPTANTICYCAYPFDDNLTELKGKGLVLDEKTLPKVLFRLFQDRTVNCVQIWEFYTESHPETINIIHPTSGLFAIKTSLKPKVENESYLSGFDDKRQSFGFRDFPLWSETFAEDFERIKYYNPFDYLIGMFESFNCSNKIRMDYADVVLQLAESNFYQPINEWMENRDLIFSSSEDLLRKTFVQNIDYFRLARYYSELQYEVSNKKQDFIHAKIASSLSALYGNKKITAAFQSDSCLKTGDVLSTIRRNLYWGGDNFVFLNSDTNNDSVQQSFCSKHLAELSFNLDQLYSAMQEGVNQAKIAIMFPVSAGMTGNKDFQKVTMHTAFKMAEEVNDSGRDFIFIDDESLLRSEIINQKLCLSKMELDVVLVPYCDPIRWDVMCKLHDFVCSGGKVVFVHYPLWSNIDPFESKAKSDSLYQSFMAQGSIISYAAFRQQLKSFEQDVKTKAKLAYIHKKTEKQDFYLISNVSKGDEISFHARGKVQCWNVITGAQQSVTMQSQNDEWSTLNMPFEKDNLSLFVFNSYHEDSLNIIPYLSDVYVEGRSIENVHRREKGKEIFMITETPENEIIHFRATGKAELIDPETGNSRSLPILEQNDEWTTLTLPTLNTLSAIIVFEKSKTPAFVKGKEPKSEGKESFEILINDNWEVAQSFSNSFSTIDLPVDSCQNKDYQQDTTYKVYSTCFEIKKLEQCNSILIDFGKIKNSAKVKVNGQFAGLLFEKPWSLDITHLVCEGINRIEIEVCCEDANTSSFESAKIEVLNSVSN